MRKISSSGRERMRESGRVFGKANLDAFRAQQAGSPEELAKLAEDFERKLISDLGENLGAAQQATVLSAKVSYVVLQKAFTRFVKQRRFKRFDLTIEALGRAQGTLRRALEQLELLKSDPHAELRQALDDSARFLATSRDAHLREKEDATEKADND